jgi:hypothetical protein
VPIFAEQARLGRDRYVRAQTAAADLVTMLRPALGTRRFEAELRYSI